MTQLDDVWADTVPYLWAMLYRRGCSPCDIEDVIGDTYVRIVSRPRHMTNPSRYAATTARNVYFDLLRHRRHYVDAPANSPVGELVTEDFADRIVDQADRDAVVRALHRLARPRQGPPPSWQYALWRRYVEEATPSEIAAELGVSSDTACSLLYRARRALRAAYLEEAA